MKIINKLFVGISLLVICGNLFLLKQKDKQIEKLEKENFTLNENLKGKININQNDVKIIYRDKEKIVYKKVYIPPESQNNSITIDQDDKVKINYDKYGFTFIPFIGLAYSNKLQPEIGVRLIYYDRWGINLNIKEGSFGIGVDRRINYGIINNSAIGLFIDNNKNFGISIHTFL